MRSHHIAMSEDPHCVFPGTPATESPDTLVLPDVPLAVAISHYYLVERYTMRIDFAVDPTLSVGSVSIYTLEFPIVRPLSSPLEEIALPITGLFDWPGSIEAAAAYNGANFFDMNGDFQLFHDGWRIPSDVGGPPIGFVRPSFRFHFSGIDTGLDSTFYVTTEPIASLGLTDEAQVVSSTVTILPPRDPTNIVTACNFIDTQGSGTSPYIFGGVAPIITLTPSLCYQRLRSDNTEPMWDATTFALLDNPFSTKL